MSDLVVKELTSSLRDDFLFFFDHVAFVDDPDWFDCYCSAYENPFLSLLGSVVARASKASKKASSRPIGKTPEAATVWPSPNPPSFAHESGSILDSGGLLPVSIIFDSGWGARPETFTNGEGSLPHPGTSGGTFIIPIKYLTGLTNLW